MEQPKNSNRQPPNLPADVRREYLDLKVMEHQYWGFINTFWSRNKSPNRDVSLLPVIKHQKKLNAALFKLRAGLIKYETRPPTPPMEVDVTEATEPTQSNQESTEQPPAPATPYLEIQTQEYPPENLFDAEDKPNADN